MLKLPLTLWFVLLLALTTLTASAQGELETQPKITLRNELTGAAFLFTNGYGIDATYARRVDGFTKRLFFAGLGETKHPKEAKRSNPYLPNNNRFVFGKINNMYTLRAGIGTQKELFTKRDRNSISIRYFYTLGPSVGMLKPIYYEIIEDIGIYPEQEVEKFDPEKHMLANIVGRASFTKGFDELTFSPGAFIKAGFTFEYSENDPMFQAIEVGIRADAYLSPMEIMAVDKNEYNFLSKIEENNHFFIGLFAGFRLGKIIQAAGMEGQL